MTNYGVSNEWCYGYSQFLDYIKKFGEDRLQLT